MNCQKCNFAIGAEDAFCPNCGEPTKPQAPLSAPTAKLPTVLPAGQSPVAAPVAYAPPAYGAAAGFGAGVGGSSPLAPKKKFFASTKNRLLIAGAAVLAVVVAITVSNIVANLPKKVEIRLSIQDTYGGVFAAGCAITNDAAGRVPTSIKIYETGSKTATATAKVKFYPSGKNGCIGKAEIELNPTKHYDVIDGKDTLGTISSAEFNAGVADVAKTVEIYHAMHVNFNLYDYADYCTGPLSNWHCWWTDYLFGLNPDSSTSTCSGQNGFSDIHAGTTVSVTGQSTGRTYTSSLVSDSWDLVSVSSAQMYCKFYADFSQLPNDDAGYTVEVGTRGTVSFTIDDLNIYNWNAELNLNK